MALQAGTTLGPYEIQAPLGAGGMGEVYKARDTRLDRTVAIKVLPEHLATGPDLKQRFEREAKAIAALSHPHICALHDIGNQDGIDFLVMEHLDGQTLAQRLENGALPLDDAIQIAIEIADALDKAHRQGIVHRDLKPGNIMLTKSGAKLLDFGLAKLKTAGGMGAEGLTAQVTQSEPLTSQGSILGTLQYMAPEQLEGRNADARSDIFAFGAVVYEMVTGRKAFEGDSQASLIGAILHTVPPQVSAVHPEVARPLDRLVAKCLAKDPDRRWQTASDLVDDLRWISEAPDAEQTGDMPAPAKPAWRVLPWMLAAAAIVAGVLLGRAWFEGSTVAPVQELTRFTVDLDPGLRLSGGAPLEVAEFALQRPSRQSLLLSPDGRHLAYLASDGDKTRIYWRPMDQAQSVPLPGTEGPYEPFFSPGGTEVGFFNGFRFKRVSLESGEVRTITTSGLEGFSVGGSWTTADTIVLSTGEAVSGSAGRRRNPEPLDRTWCRASHLVSGTPAGGGCTTVQRADGPHNAAERMEHRRLLARHARSQSGGRRGERSPIRSVRAYSVRPAGHIDGSPVRRRTARGNRPAGRGAGRRVARRAGRPR